MKKVLRNGFVMVMAALFVSVFSIGTSKAQGSVSLQVFYDELQPYGTWMQHGSYGYVWMPRVDRGFTPYATNGYWINTDYGNTWVSDYSWGWAPFHYGRWFHDDFYGWMWVPDSEWAPAWVAWRSGGGYYGWAPLMPGFGINVSFSYYDRLPNHYWNFVPYRYVTYRTVYSHCVPRPHVVNIIHNTTIITHNYTDNRRRTYFTGPTRSEMERTGRTRVDVYKVSDRGRPGRTEIDRGTVSLYKPEVNGSRETRASSMPSRYLRADQNGNREMVESPRRERTKEYAQQDFDNAQQRNAERSNRSRELENNPSLGRQSMDRREDRTEAFERFDRDRENMNREQQNYNQRSEQLERQSSPRSAERSDQNMRQQPDNNLRRSPQQQSQKLEQMQRQSSPRSMERSDQNFRQPSNEVRRSSDQSQRTQQMERQNSGRSQNGSRQFDQPSQNVQRQRTIEAPSMNRNSTQQRQPQIERSSSQQRSNQPARSGASERGSSLRRN